MVFFEDDECGVSMIVVFVVECGVIFLMREVIDYFNSLDDEEIDVEMIVEMFVFVVGG